MTTIVEKCPACGSDVIDRTHGDDGYYEPVCPNGNELNRQMYEVQKAIRKYYLALDNRKNGHVAEVKAFQEIQKVMGMHWKQGAMKSVLERHPKLNAVYSPQSAD